MMTRSEIQTKIIEIRNELETRHKYGAIKMANKDGLPIPTEDLQSEMYSLIYRISKMD